MIPRWARAVLFAQGAYYALTALWGALAFDLFQAAVRLPINHFQATAFAALAVPLGVALAAAGWSGAAALFAARLGAGTALCLAATEIIWLPQFDAAGALWLDLPVEIAFTLALGWAGLRKPPFDPARGEG